VDESVEKLHFLGVIQASLWTSADDRKES